MMYTEEDVARMCREAFRLGLRIGRRDREAEERVCASAQPSDHLRLRLIRGGTA